MNSTLVNTLNADQRRALENVRDAAARIWARPLHRTFTDHTPDHSGRIIALLDGLTAGMMATDKRLSPTEVWVLLAAAYLHDIGMQNEKFAGGDLDEIRDQHHEQTAEMIYAVFEAPASAFAIPLARDPAMVEAVALVAKGHRRVDLAAPEYEPLVHGSETLRPRLLAALLRFGDELDIDHRRVDMEQIKLLALPTESLLHWWKCHYVGGVSIVDEYIRIAYRFPQDRPDYEGLIVPLVEEGIRAGHAALEEIFRADAVKVALGKSQVRLMRLVQPLPPEVEALAREKVEGAGGTDLTPQPPSLQGKGESDSPPRVGEGEGEGLGRPETAQPQDDFRYDAFISYSHKDGDWVRGVLLPRLEGEGLRPCIDYRDFEIGLPSLVNMENAVERSRKTLLVLTPNWLESEWTTFEGLLIQTRDPVGRGRRMLPLLVQPCRLPDRLQMFTYLDLTDPAGFDFQMARLVAAIRPCAKAMS